MTFSNPFKIRLQHTISYVHVIPKQKTKNNTVQKIHIIL